MGRLGRKAAVSGAVAVVVVLSGVVPAVAAAATTTVVSYAPDGSNADNSSFNPSISADGRYVAFESRASNLVAGDTNDNWDVFRRDLATGDIVRVSVADDETQANLSSYQPSISADGRYVAFYSIATNLVGGDDTNSTTDVFVRDLTAGTTVRVSVADDETQATGDSYYPSISADGRYVAFESYASNLVGSDDTNGNPDVFVRDLTDGTTVRVSVADNEDQADGNSFNPSISADGQRVAFQSDATNLVGSDDTNGNPDVFVRDLTDGTTTRVSVDSAEAQALGSDSFNPSISADGLFVAFYSFAPNLVTGDTNVSSDVFLRDLTAGTTVRVSVADDETEANGYSFNPSISANGRYVAFSSEASNLVADDTNSRSDVFVRDLTEGTTTRVSVNALGVEGNFVSLLPSISADGQRVAFQSAATNLTTVTNPPADTCETFDWDAPVFADDSNCKSDVFVYGPVVELPATGANTNGFVATAIVFLATGAVLVATRRRRPVSV
ncbi:unannotated protein [freshwater metagenome]|uniref:Unannotated protein n=1 Tax=freshwater metagenome TaxID=449393 RepID=A0A6J7NCQ6_9ZZZZ